MTRWCALLLYSVCANLPGGGAGTGAEIRAGQLAEDADRCQRMSDFSELFVCIDQSVSSETTCAGGASKQSLLGACAAENRETRILKVRARSVARRTRNGCVQLISGQCATFEEQTSSPSGTETPKVSLQAAPSQPRESAGGKKHRIPGPLRLSHAASHPHRAERLADARNSTVSRDM